MEIISCEAIARQKRAIYMREYRKRQKHKKLDEINAKGQEPQVKQEHLQMPAQEQNSEPQQQQIQMPAQEQNSEPQPQQIQMPAQEQKSEPQQQQIQMPAQEQKSEPQQQVQMQSQVQEQSQKQEQSEQQQQSQCKWLQISQIHQAYTPHYDYVPSAMRLAVKRNNAAQRQREYRQRKKNGI